MCFLLLMISFVDYRSTDRHSNYARDMFSSSTPIHHEQLSSRSHVSHQSDHVTYLLL